jgi:hypothetical protein
MLRLVVRFHMFALLTATTLLLCVPMLALEGFGIASTNSVHSLLRVIACLLAVIAAASLGVEELPRAARGPVLLAMGAAYTVTTVMLLAQQIAIWHGGLGVVLVAISASLSGAFLWLGSRERLTPVAGA